VTSSTLPFVRALRPRYVIFSAAKKNRWGFPAPSVRRRWHRTGACLLTTGDAGAILFETDELHRLRFQWSYRQKAARPWDPSPAKPPECGS